MTYPFEPRGKRCIIGPRTWIMGVLNVTPDSFYDGGKYFPPQKAVERGIELANQGVDILDIGGESSRPGSERIPEEEELRRVLPVLEALRPRVSCLISIDTMRASVAEAAIKAGADIINDISALRADPEMVEVAVQSGAGVILMHMKGTPQTMQLNPVYGDVVKEIYDFLQERMEWAQKKGVLPEKIIVDPGIGFGKRLEDNLRLINELSAFLSLGRPILIGVSRKSFIGQLLNLPPEERLEGTIASAVISLIRGAAILRVHDALAVKRAVAVTEAILYEKRLVSPTESVEHVQ